MPLLLCFVQMGSHGTILRVYCKRLTGKPYLSPWKVLQNATAATTIANLAADLLKIPFYGHFIIQHLIGSLARLQAERPLFRVALRGYMDMREMRADEWDWTSMQKYVSLQNTAKIQSGGILGVHFHAA